MRVAARGASTRTDERSEQRAGARRYRTPGLPPWTLWLAACVTFAGCEPTGALGPDSDATSVDALDAPGSALDAADALAADSGAPGDLEASEADLDDAPDAAPEAGPDVDLPDVDLPDVDLADADGDAGGPVAPPPLGEVEVFTTEMSEGRADALLWVGYGRSEAWLERDGSSLRLVRSGIASNLAWPEGVTVAGPLVAAAASVRDVIVGGAFGLMVVRDGVVIASPLADRFANDPVRAVLRVGGEAGASDALWISADSGLWRWRDGVRAPVTAEGLRLAPGLLAGPAPIATAAASSVPAVWLAADGGVLALHGFPDAPALSLERPDLRTPQVTALGTTRGGLVLALHDGLDGSGQLRVRTQTAGRGTWLASGRELADVGGLASLASHAEAPVAWLRTVAGALLLVREDASLAAASGPPELAEISAFAAIPDGRLLVATPAGVRAVAAGNAVSLGDVPPDGELRSAVVIAIRPTDLAAVSRITATLTSADGASTDLAVRPAEAGALWPTIALDPLALPNDRYTLAVVVTWQAGVSRTVSAELAVSLPAWTDVGPALTRVCGGCHATGNLLRRVALDVPDVVAARVDEVLCRADLHQTPRSSVPECTNLGTNLPASMPPGNDRLSPEVLATLRAWRDAGFRP